MQPDLISNFEPEGSCRFRVASRSAEQIATKCWAVTLFPHFDLGSQRCLSAVGTDCQRHQGWIGRSLMGAGVPVGELLGWQVQGDGHASARLDRDPFESPGGA